MKKFFIVITLVVFIAGLINAQEAEGTTGDAAGTTVTAAAAPAASQMFESNYYKVYSEISMTHAQQTAGKLDAYFELYNSYFHFDPSDLTTKMKVKLLANQENYEKYLTRTVPDVKNSFVYLQYKNDEKSELVGYYEDNDTFDSSLVHHSFIQYLKSFIRNPPLWLQKGFAIYFEKSVYVPEQKKVTYRENLSWLETLKDFIARSDFANNNIQLFPISNLLVLDISQAEAKVDVFYAESWGLVHFLANSEYKTYNRLLWDAVAALDPVASKAANEKNVQANAFSWVNPNLFQSDFLSYVSEVKSFPELVQQGMDQYTEGDLDEAEKSFEKALAIDETHYIPLYYMGLINYSKGDYAMAEYYYQSSLQLGGNPGLAYYALGVNSFADNRFDDAIFYLQQSVDVDPDGYGVKSEQLIARIQEEIDSANAFGGEM